MDCKYCGEEMEIVDSWPIPNPFSTIAPACAAYLECENCKAGLNTEREIWTPPDPYAEEEAVLVAL